MGSWAGDHGKVRTPRTYCQTVLISLGVRRGSETRKEVYEKINIKFVFGRALQGDLLKII